MKFAGTLPAQGMSFKGRAPAPWWAAYAMNIRAAEAIVSSAPKAMKIFPISEVSSQVEVSLAAAFAATAATGLVGASATVVCEAAGCS